MTVYLFRSASGKMKYAFIVTICRTATAVSPNQSMTVWTWKQPNRDWEGWMLNRWETSYLSSYLKSPKPKMPSPGNHWFIYFFPIFTLVWLKHYRLLGKNNKKIRNFKKCFFSFVCGLPMSTLSLTLILHVFPKKQKINKNNFQTKPNVHKEDHPNMSPNCSLIMP